MPPAIEALRAAHDRGTPTLPVFREDFEDTGFGLVSRTYIAAACNAAPELLAELDKAQRSAAHWHECFQALERAIVGETGASAIHEAARLRAEVDRLKAERDALRARSEQWRSLYRRAVNEANGLTNYVEDRPELRHAERKLTAIESEARALTEQA